MYATIHGRGRMMIPAQARKKARIVTGDVVSVQPEGNGRIVLVKMKQPKSKPVRQKLFNIEPWDSEDLARALRNQQADRDYPIEAMIRAQAFPRD